MNHYPLILISNTLWVFALWMSSASASFDHSLYDSVLKTHVQEGLVDYKNLKKDKRLDEYLEKLKTAKMDQLVSRNDKLAFWTNAYNAYTLKLITNYYPLSSIMDIKEPGFSDAWDIPLAHVAGNTYTLDQVENSIIRHNWPDPRIHYALVCAAQSCPQLRSEAYTAELLEAQFNNQAEWFMKNRNQFDLKNRKAELSKVYEWYAVDFGKNTTEALETLIPHVDDSLAKNLEKDARKWTVSFSEWDWKLNEKK